MLKKIIISKKLRTIPTDLQCTHNWCADKEIAKEIDYYAKQFINECVNDIKKGFDIWVFQEWQFKEIQERLAKKGITVTKEYDQDAIKIKRGK